MKHFESVSDKSSSKKKRHEETVVSHDSHPSFNKDVELCTVLESEERTTGRSMSPDLLALYKIHLIDFWHGFLVAIIHNMRLHR